MPFSGSDELATPNLSPTPLATPSAGINALGNGTNNFVTKLHSKFNPRLSFILPPSRKLFSMINDPKFQHLILRTELGTLFVVSNIGEFSCSILGRTSNITMYASLPCHFSLSLTIGYPFKFGRQLNNLRFPQNKSSYPTLIANRPPNVDPGLACRMQAN